MPPRRDCLRLALPAVQLYERLTEKDNEAVQPRFFLGSTLAAQGRLHFEMGELEVGRRPLERGAAILETLVAENPLVGSYRGGLAAALNMLSDLDRATDHLEEAGRHAAKASDLLETLVREAPDSVQYLTSLAKASNVVGRVAAANGDSEAARKAFGRAVEILESMPQTDPNERYNAACNESLIAGLLEGDTRAAQVERAMAAIERAIAAGFANPEFYRRDTDFDPIRAEPAFQKVLESLEK